MRATSEFGRRRRRASGFSLIEVVAASLIFFGAVVFSLETTASATDQADTAVRTRQLRMLAERQLGAIMVFERHYDESTSVASEEIPNLPEDLRDAYSEWTWSLDIQDSTAFGTQKDQNAPYLFEAPSTKDDAAGGTTGDSGGGAGGAPAQKKGETQLVRQLVLTVRSPDNDSTYDTIEVVTFLPAVQKKSAAAAPAAGGN